MTVENGQFVIQNQKVLALCEEFGTPLYVYDGNKIEEKVNALKDTFKEVKMKIFRRKMIDNGLLEAKKENMNESMFPILKRIIK
jgi:diaminopimelate decarboxylase